MANREKAGETFSNKRNYGIICLVLATTVLYQYNTKQDKPNHEIDCGYSRARSHGFFCETEENWRLKGEIYAEQETKQIVSRVDDKLRADKGAWWQLNYEPNFSCSFEKRLGTPGDGGKWICDPHGIKKVIAERNEKCLVLSFGSNNMWDFEESILHELPQCEIHTFDHTIIPENVPMGVNFHKIGLNYTDSDTAWTLDTILDRLELSDYTIEIMKVDIEFWEWDILVGVKGAPGVLFHDNVPFFRQLAIELHPKIEHLPRIRLFFAQMKQLGYVIAHKEPNTFMLGRFQEYLFVKTGF